jgi:hypothetical protein
VDTLRRRSSLDQRPNPVAILRRLAFFGIFSFRHAHDPMVKQGLPPAGRERAGERCCNHATRRATGFRAEGQFRNRRSALLR